MGASYSQPALKTALKMAASRLAMHRNKKLNQITVDSKAVALLLQAGKDESARIRCEAILHEKNLAGAYEMLQLMCELLAARVPLITASKECPVDLTEGIASIIYCSTRVEVPELRQIAEQMAAKYGREWAEKHANNDSGKVHPRIQEKLSIRAPSFEVLLAMLEEIAATYQVEWKPDLASLEAGIVDHSNPERLGSIARIERGGGADAPAAAAATSTSAAAAGATDSPTVAGHYPIANFNTQPGAAAASGEGGLSPYPGTLNLILQRGRDVLNLASQSDPHDLYVQITNLSTGVTWRSAVDTQGGANPLWQQNPRLVAEGNVSHFPLSVADATTQIQLEIFQRNVGKFKLSSDRQLGVSVVYADAFRLNAGNAWYPLFLQSMQTGYLLITAQYLPLNAQVLSQEELNRQKAWQQQEIFQAQQQQQQQQMQQQMGSPNNAVPVPNMAMLQQQQQQYAQPNAMGAAAYNGGGAPGAGGPGYNGGAAPGAGAGAGGNSNNGGGGGGAGVLGGLRASLQPPLSPPHNLDYTVGDILAGRHKPPSNGNSSQPGSCEPGSESDAGPSQQRQQQQQQQQQQARPPYREKPPEPVYAYDADAYEEEVGQFSEFPPVPHRTLYTARADEIAAAVQAAKAAGTFAQRQQQQQQQQQQPGSAAAAAAAVGGPGGAGTDARQMASLDVDRTPDGPVVVSASPMSSQVSPPPAAAALSADEEMEARFRRLNQP